MSNEYTREWWKERLSLIQAWAEGKKLQFKDGCDWLDSFDTCCFESPLHMYRIAPELKLRPWKPEEVPVLAAYKAKIGGTIYLPILKKDCGEVYFAGEITRYKYTAQELLEHFLHSTDGGKTWNPCGVMEEQQ